MRDSHEYIKKQVWGEFICTRQNSKKFDLLRTRLTEAVLIPFTSQFVYTRMSLKSELCPVMEPVNNIIKAGLCPEHRNINAEL